MPLLFAPPSDVRTPSDGGAAIEIGVLNNLSDAGLDSGDRQIVDLLRAAAGPLTVRLRFFSLPSIPRGPAGRAHIAARYTDFWGLREARLDGLFVTGCEPRASRLPDEPFWPQLTGVMDWAEHNTRSTIWSCLAAHAAVLHLDGIERRPLAAKCSGLFRVARVGGHPLLAGAPAALRVAHSRYNDLDAGALTAAGYQVLTQGPGVGVDTFVKGWRSLFVYLQGHPEYDGDALRREYRRDVLRFLEGTRDTYPDLPVDYFAPATAARLRAFAATAPRDPALIATLPLGPPGVSGDGAQSRQTQQSGRGALATTLFRNWLTYLHARTTNHAT